MLLTVFRNQRTGSTHAVEGLTRQVRPMWNDWLSDWVCACLCLHANPHVVCVFLSAKSVRASYWCMAGVCQTRSRCMCVLVTAVLCSKNEYDCLVSWGQCRCAHRLLLTQVWGIISMNHTHEQRAQRPPRQLVWEGGGYQSRCHGNWLSVPKLRGAGRRT